MTRKKQQCQRFTGIGCYPCDRNATKLEDGKWYCWQHCHSHRQKKAKERQEASEKRMRELNAKWDAEDARRKLERAAGVDSLSDEDLRAIAGLGGVYAMIRDAMSQRHADQLDTAMRAGWDDPAMGIYEEPAEGEGESRGEGGGEKC